MGHYGGGRQPRWRELDRSDKRADATKTPWATCPKCGEAMPDEGDETILCDTCQREGE